MYHRLLCDDDELEKLERLALKLHHKHDSSQLIKTLNEHGVTSTYDEVLRFRKSVAKFVLDNHSDYHKKFGLSRETGPIFS